MEWHFHYDGPVPAEDSRRCPTCQAKALKECHTHGKAFDAGCAHCQAARGAPCQSHWGIRAALDAHDVKAQAVAIAASSDAAMNAEISAGAEKDWDVAKGLVLAELEAQPAAAYARVDLRGSRHTERGTNLREFVANVFLR